MDATMPPEATPRPAATILLLRDSPDGMEVFMVVRHENISFAGGALVFPGGRVEDADHALAARLPAALIGDPAIAPFRIAAIRETYEECGVLLARPRGSSELVGPAVLQDLNERFRAELNAGKIGFDQVLDAAELEPATDHLVHFAHWITPANQPKRYDTHFFLALAPSAHLAVHDGYEAVDSIWIKPLDAVTGCANGQYKLVFATQKNLEKLGRASNAAEAITQARGARIVTVQPHPVKVDGTKRLLRIPAEADYGGSEFVVDLPPASA